MWCDDDEVEAEADNGEKCRLVDLYVIRSRILQTFNIWIIFFFFFSKIYTMCVKIERALLYKTFKKKSEINYIK